MNRYTLVLNFRENSLDKVDLESAFGKHFSNSIFRINNVMYDNVTLLIFVKSELSKERISKILIEVVLDIGLEINNILWGWSIPKNISLKLEEKDIDPNYYKISPELKEDSIYKYGIGAKLIAGIPILGLIFGVIVLIQGVQNNSVLIWIGLYLVILIGFILIMMKSSIICRNNLIQFNFWFRPSKKLYWSEIWQLKLFIAGGDWCRVYGKNNKVDFPVDQIYQLKDKEMLLKTIIHQSSLVFVGPAGTGNAIYRRPNS